MAPVETPAGRPKAWESWLACAVVGMGFALRMYGLGFQSLWRDETDALFFATRPLSRILATFAIPGRNGPLYFLLLRGWMAFTGDTEFALRCLSVVAGVLALPLTLAVARRLGCGRAGLWALPLMAFSPFLVWYAQDAKMYSTVLLAVLLATWLFLKGLETWHPLPWLGYGLVLGASLYLHLLTFLVVPVHLVWLAMDRRARFRSRGVLLAAAALFLLALPLLLWGVPLLLSDYQSGHPFYPLGRMVQALLVIWTGGIAGPPGRWALVLPLFLALAGVFLSPPAEPGPQVRPATSRSRLGEWARARMPALRLLAWLILPGAALYLISLKVPLFTERYLIWLTPAWYLLVGMGLERLADVARDATWVRPYVVGGALLVALLALAVPPLWTQYHAPIKSDFRSVAAYVGAHRQKGDLVLFQMPHVRRTFQYYYRGPYRWAEAPYTNHGQTPEEIGQQMEELTGGYRRVWLVLSEPEMWDRRGLVRQWLDGHAQPVESRNYARVELICYNLGGDEN